MTRIKDLLVVEEEDYKDDRRELFWWGFFAGFLTAVAGGLIMNYVFSLLWS